MRVVWLALGGAALATGTIAFAVAGDPPQRGPAPPPEPATTVAAPPVASVAPMPAPPIAVDAGVTAPDAPHANRPRISPEAVENPYP
jgi:hypothetical protein